MSGTISKEKIIHATHKGIQNSFKDYEEWSGGEWLWNAPEYLITVKIAQSIAKIDAGKYVTLEDNVDYVLTEGGKKARVKKVARKNGRSDIVLWFKNCYPRAIIEVKNSVYTIRKIEEDIDRIEEVIKKSKTIDWGLIAFYTDGTCSKGNAQQKVLKQIDKIYNDIKIKYTDLKISYDNTHNVKKVKGDADYWTSVIFLLEMK